MGALFYNGDDFEFEDRPLAHLQVVISTKLRRREPFVMSWRLPVEMGSGRRTVWIENGVAIHFAFATTLGTKLNPRWIEDMMVASARAGGLEVGPESLVEVGSK